MKKLLMYDGQNPPINGFNYAPFIFPESWKGYLLKGLFSVRGGRPISRNNMSDTGIACLHYGDIHTTTDLSLDVIKQYNSLPKVKDNQYKNSDLLRDGDIVFADASEDYGGIAKSIVIEKKSEKEIIAGLHTVVASSKEKEVNELFRKYMFSNWLVRKQLMFFAQGISVFGISKTNIENTVLVLPPLLEQKKIAEILSTWDDAISIKSRIIEFENRKKKAIVSKVYRGNLSNNPDFSNRFLRLKKYLREIKKKNGIEDLPVLSVSNSRGFILQEEQFDRVVASTDRSNYKVLEKDQLAYNPSRVNVGSIDLMVDYDKGILSPMYVVFKCQDGLESRYLYHFLKSDLFLQMIPKFTQGSVRDSLSFSALTSMKMYIPSVQEQLKYINALDAVDRKIAILNNEVQFLKKQKQGLMQQLLTGKIRVKVS